jgi:hypothetical protein
MSKRFSSAAGTLLAAVAIATAAAAQAPRIGNGRVTTQAAGTPFVQSFRSLVGAQTDAARVSAGCAARTRARPT